MAFRIDQAIVRGEITNEVPGIVTGRIWLAGREKPIVLQLEGNCLTDLAGSSLTFSNPSPSPQTIDGLATYQIGKAGSMTASQKVRVPTVSDEELTQLIAKRATIPSRWSNCLYLEWFSDANGRVVIQSENLELTLSEPRWLLPKNPPPSPDRSDVAHPPDASPFSREENDPSSSPNPFADIGDDFLIGPDGTSEDDDFDDEPLNEFEWEQELRDAELRADAYQDALEKFHEHLDHLEPQDEAGESPETEQAPGSDSQLPIVSESETGEALPHKHHELTGRAMELAVSIRDESERHNLLNLGSANAGADTPIMNTIAATVQFGGRLAAALDGIANGADPEHGFIIAMLKRSLVPLNDCLHHGTESITAYASIPALVSSLADARIQLFDLRREILDLMEELRASS